MNVRTAILYAMVLILPSPVRAESSRASVTIDASVTVSSFIPLHIFGNNAPAWADPVPVQKKIEEAGNYLIRIPGGSWGDVYHWNSKGEFDPNGVWVPSATEYGPSKLEKNYQPKYSSVNVVDDKRETAWQSNPDTDFPDAQWIYVELKEQTEVDGLEVVWGDKAEKKLPYAKVFSVQYWDPKNPRQWMVYGADQDGWKDLLTDVKGKGGAQKLSFAKTRTQNVRLLMKKSSAGKGGTYTVAEMKPTLGGKAVSLTGWLPAVSSSIFMASSGFEDRKIFGFEEFMDFLNSFEPKAVPLVIVNFGTGTPQEAAAWVHYANKVKNYGIKYWEIGNEVGGKWEAGGPVHSVDYARRYIAFYEAMKAEDPTIRIVAQVGVTDPSGAYDGKPCLQSFVDRLAKDGKQKYLDIASVHQYSNWGQNVKDLLDSPVTQMADLAASVKKQLAAYPELAEVPIWMSEFNTSDQVKPRDISVRIENGLWLAQYMPEFIRNFGTRGYMTLWDVLNGGTALKDEKGGDHGYLQAEEGPYQYQERADYWTMTMLTNHWALPGDARLHSMVKAESDAPGLAVYADRRPDGKLTLLAVNKDPERPVAASIAIAKYAAVNVARGWEFDRDNYEWRTESKPYHADPDAPPTPFRIKRSNGRFKHVFPPYSITVLQFTR
jgi:hypothetical protein